MVKVLQESIQSLFPLGWTGLISLQFTLKSLIPHYNSKALFLQCSAFFMAQFSQLYITTGKIIPLTILTFVSKMMPLCLITPSRLVIAFLPRNMCLLISWLQPPSAVILECKKTKNVTVSLSIFHGMMGSDAKILVF